MSKIKYKNPYNSENELCNIFIEYAKKNNWRVFPETSNFDILIVKNNFQVGIQAKLKPNIDVIAQSLDHSHEKSPNIKAILVPQATRKFKLVCKALKIYVIEGVIKKCKVENNGKKINIKVYWDKEIKTILPNENNKYYLRISKNKCWIPDVEINTPAGVKSPKRITEWKVKAVKICIKLNEKKFLTSMDFKLANLSMIIWRSKKWIIDSGEREGRMIKYIKNPIAILPDVLYPEISELLVKQ